MKLYYKKAACSLVVRIILNEIGVSFETEEVDLKEKPYQSDKDFRKINPKGSVPTLELDNGVILTENAVIYNILPIRLIKITCYLLWIISIIIAY